ncbi:hypothetical protein H072_779 [Dactylellina haptotyla CBS 200.50]|uniref:Copper-fist domain-containing protein n=1 Tax=Dactylellina haptotyla (strain CBS 200.50) TaxID=1284197 RepID=S8AQS6_DACHA|nr:hypothetical protein H072_779 [Dactylellina haptotyla CBS 200.50]
MPIINGVKFACEPCMRGHRSSKCTHTDRILIKVRKPGRPLSSCPHEAGSCSCEVASVAIPKISSNCPCGTPPGVSKQVKKEDKGPKSDRARASSQTSSIPTTPASQPPVNMGYAFPNGFLSGIDNNGMVPALDHNHSWQNQTLGGMNVAQFSPSIDLNSPSGHQFYPGDMQPGLSSVPMANPPTTKSCCKPEPGNSSVDGSNFIDATASAFPGIQPLHPNPAYGDFSKEQRTRRHTAEMYPRKRASLGTYPEVVDVRQFGHGLDGRSTSVPNVVMTPNMMNGAPYGTSPIGPVPEDSQNSAYTIYSAPRYNQKQLMYMNAIREAHEKQQQEEADAARRAGQAGEHAQKLNGSCCPPSDNTGLQYALPHGQECACGPNCSCVMCITHPYNTATIEYIRNIHETLQPSEHSSEGHSPSTQGFAHSVAGGAEFPPNGSVGVFGDVVLDGMLEEKGMHGIQSGPLSPSAFIQFDYHMGTCSQQNGCMCGDGCTCVGCLTHGGHNGIPLHLDASMLSQQAMGDQPLDDTQHLNNQGVAAVGGDHKPAVNNGSETIWKTEDPATGPEIQASAN